MSYMIFRSCSVFTGAPHPPGPHLTMVKRLGFQTAVQHDLSAPIFQTVLNVQRSHWALWACGSVVAAQRAAAAISVGRHCSDGTHPACCSRVIPRRSCSLSSKVTPKLGLDHHISRFAPPSFRCMLYLCCVADYSALAPLLSTAPRTRGHSVAAAWLLVADSTG